jgi:hypothetical protein
MDINIHRSELLLSGWKIRMNLRERRKGSNFEELLIELRADFQ